MNFGSITHEKRELNLTQSPYAEYDGTDHWYQAIAIDDDENEYLVKWKTINDDCEDESNACDWTKFSVVSL